MSKKKLSVLFICFFSLTFLTIKAYPVIWGNYSDCIFEPGCRGENAAASGEMGVYGVEGAGYFLDANSQVKSFLQKIEMSGIRGVDYNALRENLDRVIHSMEKAVAAYSALKKLAKKTPYNRDALAKLRAFDLDGFCLENGLNKSIFKEVKKYLGIGDVRGMYKHVYRRCRKILRKLYVVKEAVDNDRFPEIKRLWDINEAFDITLLTGQYTARVFHGLLYRR